MRKFTILAVAALMMTAMLGGCCHFGGRHCQAGSPCAKADCAQKGDCPHYADCKCAMGEKCTCPDCKCEKK